ncbi:hypothetical protein [Mesorhizobium australicum]|uniref:Uncharacterized protein n=1 Tax=Mesorhizobium australicum TaxID=536018 RepID=A0A1X7MNU3_9HYPH|nr:hypothetical protein [Mesorhizobium australicum]SMH26519.1 hypothetical protein SAMN02982922_0293 [Mesorhizobium australicum]
MSDTPIRLPDAVTVEAVLAGLDPASAGQDLAPALSDAFPGFAFSTAAVDDFYWRDARTVLAADGARLGDHRAWVERELAAHDGDLAAFWNRYRDSGLCFTEWRGTAAFGFAPTGPGVADFVQLSFGREIEVLAGPVVDPSYRPWSADDLLEPSWVQREPVTDAPVLAGPVFRLQRRSGLIHMRSFLATRQRLEREEREVRRPELEARATQEVGRDYMKETPFLKLNPEWFDLVPREVRMFQDWQRSSASAQRIFEHWAFDIKDYQEQGRRKLSFIPRPLKMPAERLLGEEGGSIHRLMERIEAVDAEAGLSFAWFFLMTHGHWVDPDIGHAIADGLRAGRVRLLDRDARVLLDWTDNRYIF